jgi:hypothetical protein
MGVLHKPTAYLSKEYLLIIMNKNTQLVVILNFCIQFKQSGLVQRNVRSVSLSEFKQKLTLMIQLISIILLCLDPVSSKFSLHAEPGIILWSCLIWP